MSDPNIFCSIRAIPREEFEMAKKSRIFTEWYERARGAFDFESVEITAVDFKGRERGVETVMFVRLSVMTSDVPFPQIVELRGGTVVMLVVLVCEGEEYLALIKQDRLAIGMRNFLEVPAGMIDGGTFKGAAAREIKEELGLVFTESELIDMTAKLFEETNADLYFSPGLLDEHARFYGVRRQISRSELDALHNKTTGVAEEGEATSVVILPMEYAALYLRDLKSIAALHLYEELKKMVGTLSRIFPGLEGAP